MNAPMNTMVPRPTEPLLCRLQLASGPGAAAEARTRVRAAVCAWDVPADPDVAVLLTSELVTNAIRHEPGGTVTLAITRTQDRLRVDVHDTSRYLPVLANSPADAETGRGLLLVSSLSAEWGVYRTRSGKAVYFTLALQHDRVGRGARGPRRLAAAVPAATGG